MILLLIIMIMIMTMIIIIKMVMMMMIMKMIMMTFGTGGVDEGIGGKTGDVRLSGFTSTFSNLGRRGVCRRGA